MNVATEIFTQSMKIHSTTFNWETHNIHTSLCFITFSNLLEIECLDFCILVYINLSLKIYLPIEPLWKDTYCPCIIWDRNSQKFCMSIQQMVVTFVFYCTASVRLWLINSAAINLQEMVHCKEWSVDMKCTTWFTADVSSGGVPGMH